MTHPDTSAKAFSFGTVTGIAPLKSSAVMPRKVA
jgi:hypothetical protein